jgi:protein-S-isoprenylcysteine O-methyltransferase Ste14
MKKKLIFTFFAILILNIFPLILKPELIFNYKNIVLIIAAAILWISQPAFSKAEMDVNRNNDKFSILFILLSSSVSVLISIFEWGYFTQNKNQTNFVSVLGLIMLITGTVVRIWSIYLLGKNFTATVKVREKHELISKGPYRIIRHPSYFGALIAICGCPVFLNNFFSIIISFLLMMSAYIYRIKFEERVLQEYFGNAYLEYKKKTYTLLPFIW